MVSLSKRARRSMAVLIVLTFVGCGTDRSAELQESRAVAYDPTQAGALPQVILGAAPAPRGTDFRYVPNDSTTRGYLAVPGGEGPFPAVVLIHEWNGLVDRIRQMADAFAAEGYVALAADLYAGRTGSNRAENMALVREARADSAGVIENLDAAVKSLRARDDVSGKVATIGWCFGGGMALSYALGGGNHDGTAIFYGSLVEDPDLLSRIQHEVYGTFAALDQGIPADQVERFAQTLRRIDIPNDIHIYDDVNHGFWLRVDDDPSARTAPALDAWERLKAYLDRTLGG